MEVVDCSTFSITDSWGITSSGNATDDVPEFRAGEPVARCAAVTGEWWAAAENGSGDHLVFADPYGIQPLYFAPVWTPNGNVLLVGESSRDVADAMRATGAVVETYWANVLPTLTATYDYFDCFYDNGTPVMRVLLLKATQALLVTDSGYAIVERPADPELLSLGYHSLLRRGVDRAIDQLRHASQHTPHKRIRLSGGKDSRIVLALLLASGLVDEFPIDTQDPGTAVAQWQEDILADDLSIVTQLAGRYGLKWSPGASAIPKDRWEVPVDAQLAHFQRFRGGRSFQLPPNNNMQRFREPLATVSGAGGETIGSLVGWRQLRRMSLAPEKLAQDALALFQHFTTGLPVSTPQAIQNQAANRFAATFAGLSDSGFAEANRGHYFEFRNRAHAGAQRWSQWSNHLSITPLMQPEFLLAANMLTEDFGRVGYDLIEMIEPELNDLRFQSGPWDFATERKPAVDWDTQFPTDLSSWNSKPTSNPVQTNFPVRTQKSDSSNLIVNALKDMQSHLREDGLDPTVLDAALESPPTDRRGQGRWLTRLATYAHCRADPGSAMAPSASPYSPVVMTVVPGKHDEGT